MVGDYIIVTGITSSFLKVTKVNFKGTGTQGTL